MAHFGIWEGTHDLEPVLKSRALGLRLLVMFFLFAYTLLFFGPSTPFHLTGAVKLSTMKRTGT